MKTYSYIEVKQPIGVFYLSSIPATHILSIVDSLSRRESNEGVQREKSQNRIKEIGDYCSDTDAIFPTPIVISINKDAKVVFDEEKKIIALPDGPEKIGEVIDGQHRLWGINESSYKDSFELPVVFMFDLTTEEKAYVFSTINSNQKKVDPSLIYDLFDVSTKRSPYKTAHEIARMMNYNQNSPFFNRLKMLGKKEKYQSEATLSQGTFAKSIVMLISKNPDDDARRIKRGDKLEGDERLPFRDLFIKDKDETIAKVVMNCFTALKNVFPDLWKKPKDNILWKTTGFRAVIYSLPSIIRKGYRDGMLTELFFAKCFEAFKQQLLKEELTLTSESFPGGGEQSQKKLANLIVKSIANIDISSYNNNLLLVDSIDDFIESCDFSIYELCDLAHSIEDGTTLYSTIQVIEGNDKITIIHPCSDVSLEINNADRKKILNYLEKKYFDDSSADQWLAYREALEKND